MRWLGAIFILLSFTVIGWMTYQNPEVRHIIGVKSRSKAHPFCEYWKRQLPQDHFQGGFHSVSFKIYADFPEKTQFLKKLGECFRVQNRSEMSLSIEFFSDQWPVSEEGRIQLQWSVFKGSNKIFEDGDVIDGATWLTWVQAASSQAQSF